MVLKYNDRRLFSNFSFENWTNVIIFAIILIYSLQLGFTYVNGKILSNYGFDYFAFWSAGKVANEKGYSQIYDLENLRTVQLKELKAIGIVEKGQSTTYSPIPAPLFPIFVVPFSLLSRMDLDSSYWIWTVINLVILFGYLIFFTHSMFPGSLHNSSVKKLLLLIFLSYPILTNLLEGQVEFFLIIFVGEFVRNAIKKKSVISGIWLGGLMLKPQLLIIIIPLIIILRYWKVLLGFIYPSVIVLFTSLFLSGVTGIKEMIDLWTKYGNGIATNGPDMMINWRMVGENINSFLNTSSGWLITGVGITLTLVAVYFLVKPRFEIGSSQWVMIMLGVFSATLAITWHSHYHMAVVLIPFLIFCSQLKSLPEKIIFSWLVITPLILCSLIIVDIVVLLTSSVNTASLMYLIPFSGFVLNIILLITIMRTREMEQDASGNQRSKDRTG